jgi:hypothetical protein
VQGRGYVYLIVLCVDSTKSPSRLFPTIQRRQQYYNDDNVSPQKQQHANTTLNGTTSFGNLSPIQSGSNVHGNIGVRIKQLFGAGIQQQQHTPKTAPLHGKRLEVCYCCKCK